MEDERKDLIDRDFYLLSGPLFPEACQAFMATVLAKPPRRDISLVLTTYGGDAHTAYRIARFLRRTYSSIRILVVGPCKSAGTLFVLGADEVAFGTFGELGPLDIQVGKKDELLGLSSGLDTLQTFGLVTGYAYSTFESYMLQTVTKSEGAISTKTACEVASDLTTGIFAPLMEQIDPHRLSEVQRMMAIAKAYGQRLATRNLRPGALERLIEGYPAHSFIIDQAEAGDLFEKVSGLTPEEADGVIAAEQMTGAALSPSSEIRVEDVRGLLQHLDKVSTESDYDDDTFGSGDHDTQPLARRESRNTNAHATEAAEPPPDETAASSPYTAAVTPGGPPSLNDPGSDGLQSDA